MNLSLLRKRYSIYTISLILLSLIFGGHVYPSPTGHVHAPPGNHANIPPGRQVLRKVGSRLYFTPACPIVAQSFNNTADVNGATSDTSSVGWYLDASKVPNAVYFAVKSHRLKAQTLGGEGVWYSKVFSIAGYTGIQVDAKISSEGTLSSAEYVKVSYKLDGGAETLIGTYTGSFGNTSTPTVTSPALTGSKVQIVVRMYDTTQGNAEFYIENYDVFKEMAPCLVSGIAVTASASNSGVLTCTNPSTTLSATTTATGTTTYSWTGPNSFTSTSANPVVSTAGTYTVTGTNSAGTGTASVTVTSNTTAPASVTATSSGSLTCSTASVTLTGASTTSGTTFTWTGPNSFTATGATATATAAGAYTLTATNPTTGCTTAVSTTVTQVTTAPAGVTATSSGSLTCSTASVTLTGASTTSGTTFTWTGPNSFKATGATATASAAGSYTVTATNPTTGCTTTASVTVTTNTTAPAGVTATSSGSLTCSTASVTLTGASTTSGTTFSWTGPNSFTATGATATASTAGAYTLTATNPTTGCKTTTSVAVTSNTTAPTGVTISTANNVTQLTCATNYIGLTGSSTTSGVSYNWTGPNNYSVASSAVNVFNAGAYTLSVTNPTNGCVSTAAITITQNITPPANVSITPSLALLTCADPSAILTGNSSTSGATYNWTGPNSFTATGINATVISQGSYILTVTDPTSGCTNTTTATISQNFTPPANVTAVNSGPLTCSNTSVSLTGNSSTSTVSYSWTGPNNFTSSNAIATTNSPGIYTLTVTNPVNGCTAIATTVVTQNDTVPAKLTTTAVPSASQLTCTNSSVVFTASSSTPGINYSWSGPSGNLSSAAVATATAVGTYTVIATNPVNGCTAMTTATVTQNITAPSGVTTTANPVTAQLTCTHPSVLLTSSAATAGVTYSWSGPGGFTATGATATVTVPGVYTVSVTDPSNGCIIVLPGTVTKNVSVPVGLSASASDVISCFSPSIDLQGVSTTPGTTFSWTGPGGFTATTAIAETDVPGNYTLIVTNPANGCTASTGTTVTADTASPAGVTASNSGPLNCINTSVTLTSSSTTSGVDYLWVTPDNNFISGASTVVTSAGLYTIVVTNDNNGCSSQTTTTVLQNTTGCASLSTLAPASFRVMTSEGITVDTVTQFAYKAYPNPFSTTEFIEFKAPVNSRVIVEIYSSYGSREKSLFNSMVTAGQTYKLELSAAGLSSGTHFCIIRTNDKVYSTKLILIK